VESLERRQAEMAAALQTLDAEKETLHQNAQEINEKLRLLQEKIEPAEQELGAAEAKDEEERARESDATRLLTSVERLHGQLQLDVTRREEALERLREARLKMISAWSVFRMKPVKRAICRCLLMAWSSNFPIWMRFRLIWRCRSSSSAIICAVWGL